MRVETTIVREILYVVLVTVTALLMGAPSTAMPALIVATIIEIVIHVAVIIMFNFAILDIFDCPYLHFFILV